MDVTYEPMPPVVAPEDMDEQRKQRLIASAGGMTTLPAVMPAGQTPPPVKPQTMPAVNAATQSRPQPLSSASTIPPVQARAPQPTSVTPPTPTAMPPVTGKAEMAAPTKPLAISTSNIDEHPTMPPIGPAQQRYQELDKQGEPKLTGWKNILDKAGQFLPFGKAIEREIGGTPQNYDAKLNQAALRAAKEQTIGAGQREAESATAKAQFETPEKRRAYMAAHPEEFAGVDDFQKNDFILAGKFPQREPTEEKPHDVVKAYSDALASGDQAKAAELAPRVQQFLDTTQKPKAAKHSAGEVKLDEGIPTGIYGDDDKLWRAGDPGMPADLKAALADANSAHGKKYQEDLAKQREGRNVLAGSRATTFVMPNGELKTVTGDDLPQFVKDNPQAVQTTPGATVQAMGRQALISDIRRAANNVRGNLTVLDSGLFDRAALGAALADPNSTVGQFLQSFPRAAEDDKTQQFVSDLYSLREQAMAMRSVLGAGQGSEDLRRAILQTLPGVGSPSSGFGEKQINNLIQALDTLEKGVPKAPQRGGGQPPPPKKGDKVDGYTFNGGDPSDKKNWSKQ